MNVVLDNYRKWGTQPCLYILKLPNVKIGAINFTNLYKFGITSNITRRLQTHLKNLRFETVILVKPYMCIDTARGAEKRIKRFAESRKERCNIMGNTEILQTQDLTDYFNVINYTRPPLICGQTTVWCNHCNKQFPALPELLSHTCA